MILSVLLTTVGLFLYYKSQHSKTIHLAAFHGKIKPVKKHLAAGVDVNYKDKEERTALDYAIDGGHKKIAKLLIAVGADVNAKDGNGWSPLLYAALGFHKEIAELLIAEGADVNAMDDDGDTPLDRVMPSGINKTETADLLRKHGGKTGEELKAEGK